ncbi:MAG TPA: hypothetical protein VEB68_07795 [Croceibacterium sp.]|nr:hypothetical protein [Croceibacterium sp.]
MEQDGLAAPNPRAARGTRPAAAEDGRASDGGAEIGAAMRGPLDRAAVN